MEQQAYTLKSFESIYNVGHTKTAQLIKSGDLKSYKVGKRRYISRAAAEQWQRRREEETTSVEAA